MHDLAWRGVLAASALVAALPAAAQTEEPDLVLPEVRVTATRIEGATPGTSTTIIDAETISRSPARTLPDLLRREAGIQVRGLYGTGQPKASVDLRGFGATAAQNTLVLVDGRRINQPDLSAAEFSSIPVESIERIEIMRGNSGAVLYGDGAVGGVINIVTKSGAAPGTAGTAEIAAGSYDHREASASVTHRSGPLSLNAFGTFIDAGGYRDNNRFLQRSAGGELRHIGDSGDLYLKLGADIQDLELPGDRTVWPDLGIDQLATDRRGTATPDARGSTDGYYATLGMTHELADAGRLIVDGGVRTRHQESLVFLFAESDLTTWSLTPRITVDHDLAGRPANSIFGVDYYFSDFESEQRLSEAGPVAGGGDARQHSIALYGSTTVAVTDRLDLSLGARVQYAGLRARPHAGSGIDDNDVETAFNLGLDYGLTDQVILYARAGRSFRLPTIEERNQVAGEPFDLDVQTSYDVEAGVRYDGHRFSLSTGAFIMMLEDELAFDPTATVPGLPFPGGNVNLDRTRRYGVEAAASFDVTQDLRLDGSITYTRAEFASGPFDGNEVPLVANWTFSAGLAWDVTEDLTFSAVANRTGDRFIDSDFANTQTKIPAATTVDLKLTSLVGPLELSAEVNNLLDEDYYEYAVWYGPGTDAFGAYPLPGRTFLVRAKARF
jgi:iron complex outermembrane receptor protein